MMPISDLASRLRSERGITQAELARAIGRTVSAVTRVEGGAGNWPRGTAIRVFSYLNSILPISREDAHEFLDHFGLSRTLADTPAPTPPFAQAPPRQGSASAFDVPPAPPDAADQVHQLADRLIAAVGPRRAADLLTAIAATVTALAPQPEPDRELAVISPPRPSSIPGAVEHTEVTYTKSPAAIKRAVKATQSPKPPPPHPKSA